MKKYLAIIPALVLSTLLFTVNPVSGQRFHAGFSIGPTATEIGGLKTRNSNSGFHKLGYMFGGIVNTSPNDKNTFQMELNYVQKGSMQPPDSMNQGYYKLAVDYVDMAFLFRHHIHFKIKQKSIDQFDWEAGASLGRMMRHSWVLDNYPAPIDLNSMNMTDISIFGGIDYNFSPKVCLNIRYSNSVIPVIKHNVIPSYLYTRFFNVGNNMAIQFTLKCVFGGAKSTD